MNENFKYKLQYQYHNHQSARNSTITMNNQHQQHQNPRHHNNHWFGYNLLSSNINSAVDDSQQQMKLLFILVDEIILSSISNIHLGVISVAESTESSPGLTRAKTELGSTAEEESAFVLFGDKNVCSDEVDYILKVLLVPYEKLDEILMSETMIDSID